MTRRIKRRRVRDIMTRSPVSVGPDTDVRKLKSLFDEHDFNAFPVVDEHGLLRGIVPSAGFYYPDLGALWARHVEDIMRRAVVTVQPDDFVETAVKLLVQYRHRTLPVVEGRHGRQKVVGILSRRDMLGCLMLEADDSTE